MRESRPGQGRGRRGTAVAIAAVVTVSVLLVLAVFAGFAGARPDEAADLLLATGEVAVLAMAALAAWLHLTRVRAVVAVALAAFAVAAGPLAQLPLLPAEATALLLAFIPGAILGAAALASTCLIPPGRLLAVALALSGATAVWGGLTLNPGLEPGCVRLCVFIGLPFSAAIPAAAAWSVTAALVCAGAVIVCVLAGNVRGAPPYVRIAAALSAIVVAVVAVVRAATWSHPVAAVILVAAPTVAVVPVVVGLLVAGIRGARSRRGVARIAAALAESGDEALGPRVQFASGRGTWMNIWGAPVPEEPSWGVIEGPDGPIARVQGARDHESDDDGLVLLVLGNARLRASIRARTRDLRGAQRQIVQTSDAESRRLERDLHDGGQQHLVSALMFLGAAADEAEGPRGLEIDVARESVREGLAQLRTLSRGLLPDTIHNDGVWNALEHAARSRGVTCRIVADGNDDLPEDVASAVFFVCEAALLVAEAADQIGGTDASVVIRASHDDSSVRVRITVSDRRFEPSGFVDPADRIGALDGVLWIDESGAIEVVVPCAS